ncbi:Nuclear pore complex protein Nup50 [Bienertia sinuspersici]
MIGTKRRNVSLSSKADDNIEKFTDVVNWLKVKSGSEDSISILGAQGTEKKNLPQTNSKELTSAPGTITFGVPSVNAGLLSSSNSGASSTQASVLSSTANSAPSWSFGLSATTQALPQSTDNAPATSWSFGLSSDNKSASPGKSVSFSTAPSFGVSSNNQAASPTSTTSFMSSTSSGIFSNSQTPAFGAWKAETSFNSQTPLMFGNQKPAALNESAKVDADEDNEPEQPSSPSVKRSEEKGIAVVHETKCKLYIKSTDPADKEPWKDKGAGKLFIKCEEGASKGTKESKPRILVRNDVGRLMLNASLYPGIKTSLQKNAIVTIFHTSDDNEGNGKAVARTYLIRVKNEEERNKLANTIREHAPAT